MQTADLPTWEAFLAPVLEVASDGRVRTRREMHSDVADHMRLTQEQRAETLKSGQGKADNRVGWAMSFLVRAEALSRPRRGAYVVTDSGRALLAAHRGGITEKHLYDITAFREYIPASRSSTANTVPEPVDTVLDPVEHAVDGGDQVAEFVAIAPAVRDRCDRSVSVMVRAVSVMSRSGRRIRPSTSHAAPTERTCSAVSPTPPARSPRAPSPPRTARSPTRWPPDGSRSTTSTRRPGCVR